MKLNGNINNKNGTAVNPGSNSTERTQHHVQSDIRNIFHFIGKASRSYPNMIDKIKVISSMLTRPQIFNHMINEAVKHLKNKKQILIGSGAIDDFRFTAISTNYDGYENKSLLVQLKTYKRLGLFIPGSITGFILRRDMEKNKRWSNKMEVRAVSLNGKEFTTHLKFPSEL